jgi:hypothetical protein
MSPQPLGSCRLRMVISDSDGGSDFALLPGKRRIKWENYSVMYNYSHLELLSKNTPSILHSPFDWCHVDGGTVVLEDATQEGGTRGGTFQVSDFAIAKYPITNAQYGCFLKHSNGFANTQWWDFSPQSTQWRKDHKEPKPTAFNGSEKPRTRVSWFDRMAFCYWLSTELKKNIAK